MEKVLAVSARQLVLKRPALQHAACLLDATETQMVPIGFGKQRKVLLCHAKCVKYLIFLVQQDGRSNRVSHVADTREKRPVHTG